MSTTQKAIKRDILPPIRLRPGRRLKLEQIAKTEKRTLSDLVRLATDRLIDEKGEKL